MRRSRLRTLARVLALTGFLPLAACAGGRSAEAAASRGSATLPFACDHNRMIVDLRLVGSDGRVRTARAWVDTGNQHLVLGEALARELGLQLESGGQAGARSAQAWATGTPGLRLGDLELDVKGVRTRVLLGARGMPGVPAEATLPASALRQSIVVLDYPGRRLTVARPGGARPRGVAVPCRINPETGLFQVEASIDGVAVALGVDNGSSYTWVSEDLLSRLQQDPGGSRAVGAVGAANFFGFDFEATGVLARLPELRLGAVRLDGVGALGLPQSLFDWYSGKSAGPVAGFLGADALRPFRLTIDYPQAMTYWEEVGRPKRNELDVVGLTLRPEADGRFMVAGVATRNGAATVAGVEPGDSLVRVDRLETAGATMGQVVDALRGRPGATRRLVLERDGQPITVDARVTRFP